MKLLIVLPLLLSLALAQNFTISLSSQPSRVKRAISRDCGCGRTSLRPQDRIVGGQEATAHSIPYQAYVKSYYRISPWVSGVGKCGGTLLNKRYVLTANHCLVDEDTGIQPTKVEVILGEHALHQNSEATQKFNASVIGRDDYKYYDKRNLNDIAILKLDRDAELDDYVIPACLPSNENDVTIIAQSDQKCRWKSFWIPADKPPTQM